MILISGKGLFFISSSMIISGTIGSWARLRAIGACAVVAGMVVAGIAGALVVVARAVETGGEGCDVPGLLGCGFISGSSLGGALAAMTCGFCFSA